MRVDRSFAFVDLCGFTRFTDTHGDEEAVQVLTRFRAVVRQIASDHAVRVDKWLGDGAMFVSTDDRRLLNALLELMGRADTTDVALPLRIGASKGPVILLEGDDYVGSAVNLAARLCAAAEANELLATSPLVDAVPRWADVVSVGALAVPGFVQRIDVVRVEGAVRVTALAAG
ncbi:MAG: adenylate/guanylate cyclase domain-containing protein [Acidimicrobiia bacterium]|jgi:class 3 adenylate cyclase